VRQLRVHVGVSRHRSITAPIVQGSNPDWRPLVEVLGEDLTGSFMWMYEARLASGLPLHAYKHIDTRRYVFLDPACNAYAYLGGERYGPVALGRRQPMVGAPERLV
jgi:hypothetical protein